MALVKKHILAIALGFFLTLYFFWATVMALNRPIGHHNDATYQYLIFHNNLTKITKGNLAGLFDTQLFYPSKTTLAFGNSLLGPSILGLPFFLLTRDPVLTANSVMHVNFFLGFLAMYMLAYRWTHSLSGSTVAGIIFAFNPYIQARALSHELTPTFWIPFTFLSLEYLIESSTWKASLALALCMLALFFSFYWVFSIAIFVFVFVLVRFGRHWSRLLRAPLVLCLVFMLPIMIWYLTPYMRVKEQYNVQRPIAYTELLSLTRADFLIAGEGSKLYKNLKNSVFVEPLLSDFVREHPAEHTLFLGFSVYALALASFIFFKFYDNRIRNIAKSLFFLAVVAIAFMLGPPGPYMILRYLVPFTSTLRVPTRFVVIVILAMAAGSAFVLNTIEQRWGKRIAAIITIVIAIVTLIEFGNVQEAPYTIPVEIQNYTRWLSAQQDIGVIVSLPIGNGNSIRHPVLDREFQLDGQYALYAIYHGKQMVNGYNSFIPPQSYTLGKMLTIDLPNPQTIKKLIEIGVDAIVVHLDEFPQRKWADRALSDIAARELEKLYQSENIVVFSLR